MQDVVTSVNLRNDIYYRSEYAELYLDSSYSLFRFEYRDGDLVFFNLAIKRPIEQIGSAPCSEIYYDLETPYGYGGFFTNCENHDFVEQALSAYRKRCQDERIIAEFIRFHPFNASPCWYKDVFDLLIDDRPVVIVDLSNSTEERWGKYNPKTRNILRKCAKTLVFQEAEDIDKFEDLYTQTMLKNNADDFYFFDREYYQGLLALDGVRLYQVSFGEKVIAMAFFMYGHELAHYHLSANDTNYLKLNGNYFMLDQAFDEARKLGANSFMLGGGRTPDSEDTLLRFKQKFSQRTERFHIAGMVHNREKYMEYVGRWEELNPGNTARYFLKYRLEDA